MTRAKTSRTDMSLAKLRDTGVDQSDVFRAGSWGVVFEGKTLLETMGEELVRNGGTCQGVQEKDFGPIPGEVARNSAFWT